MTIEYEADYAVAVITIDRPEVANAIDRPAAEELAGALRRFEQDEALAIAVLTGANGTFCAGADLKAIRSPARRGQAASSPTATARSARRACCSESR
jgi:enoyl-CoA hydratase